MYVVFMPHPLTPIHTLHADIYAAQRASRLGPWPTADAGPPGPDWVDPGYGCIGWQRCCYGVGNASCPVCPANASSEWPGAGGKHMGVAVGLGVTLRKGFWSWQWKEFGYVVPLVCL
jgi:hypothetical protein